MIIVDSRLIVNTVHTAIRIITLSLIFLLLNIGGFSQTYQWGVGTQTTNNSASDFSAAVAVDNNNNCYMTGSFMATQDFDPGPGVQNLTNSTQGEFDLFLVKYDTQKKFKWAFNLGGTGTSSTGTDIIYDYNGGLILCGDYFGTIDMDPGAGVTTITTTNWEQLNIAKYDTSGQFLWTFNIPVRFLPSNYHDNIKCDKFGNIYVTGDFTGTVDFDPGPSTFNLSSNGGRDVFFAKYDTNGNLIYARSFGGSSWDIGYNIVIDDNENIYLSGWFDLTVDFDLGPGVYNLTSNNSGTGAGCCYEEFFVKYDKNGALKFVHQYGGSFSTLTTSMILSGDGSSVYLTGNIQDSIPIDMDPGGNTNTIVAFNSSDMFIVSYDTLGNFLWRNQITYNGVNYTSTNKCASDKDGNLYVTGNMYGTIDFNPYGIPNIATSNNLLWSDVLMIKYNNIGNIEWAHLLGGNKPGGEAGTGIAIDDVYNIYLTGQIVDSNDFDPGPGLGQIPFTFDTGENLFLAKYSQMISDISDNESPNIKVNIFPNPTNDKITVEFSNAIGKGLITVYDILGKVIKKRLVTTNKTIIDLSEHNKGFYYVIVRTEMDKIVKKILVQ